ncbi:spermidine/putrescine-binding periplasmic protein precursor [Roseovarius sp. A-2]|uniref:ABC transporter substrate-binding protein n=1 Tax=Roseovarius sp. A-2 TaxID=1570360 RepID=UPI0009B52287|nr:extracellular solute-binding protein [Roseovarius sp. A-2]GAW37312.1 spermidine/putrescine-binding periplasmic protein precursor [Roseovarius sp. A-2]
MKRRDFIRLTGSTALAGGLATAGLPVFAQATELSMMTWGGLWGASMAERVGVPFTEATGVEVVQDTGSSPVERITKIKISEDDQIYDLVQLADGVVPLAEAQGTLEDLDVNSPNLPYLKDVPEKFRTKGWVAMIYSALGIVYNPDLVKNPPTSFADLWKEEYAGQIVLPAINHSIGPYIVPIGALAAGADLKDAETGFAKLRELVALDPIWARDTDSIMSALQTGEAAIGLLYKSQTYTVLANGGNVKWVFPEEGAITYMSGTGIAKGTKNLEAAEKYINATIDPNLQSWVTEVYNYAPTNPATLEKLSPELQERVQFTSEEQERIINLDQDFMSMNRADWTDMWNRIVAGG